jgi:halocyanin-like protein
MSTNDVSRRQFMRAAGGVTLAAGATAAGGQSVAAQEGNETGGAGNETGSGGGGSGNETGGGSGNESEDGGGGGGGGGGGNVAPDFGSYLSGANGYSEGGVQDARGQDSVTVAVGAGDGLAFDPATIWVSPGTTIVWEWTGEGGDHNVVPNEGPAGFSHEETVGEAGYTYEYEVTEEDAGITTYYCNPHEGQGMKGGVAVGDEVETIELETDSGPAITIPGQALSLTVATLIAMASTLGLGYFLMKFGGDYEQ